MQVRSMLLATVVLATAGMWGAGCGSTQSNFNGDGSADGGNTEDAAVLDTSFNFAHFQRLRR